MHLGVKCDTEKRLLQNDCSVGFSTYVTSPLYRSVLSLKLGKQTRHPPGGASANKPGSLTLLVFPQLRSSSLQQVDRVGESIQHKRPFSNSPPSPYTHTHLFFGSPHLSTFFRDSQKANADVFVLGCEKKKGKKKESFLNVEDIEVQGIADCRRKGQAVYPHCYDGEKRR